jgi:hypothetical protein
MPFTPLHMGPGIFLKSILQGSFSLMVFGWAQIVMDIQPLVVILTGEGHLHGFTHTFSGATILAIFAALSGKYLSQFGLWVLKLRPTIHHNIAWWVVFPSAFIGCYSHLLLDALMHSDLLPFYPLVNSNMFHGHVSIEALHLFCIYSGLFGGTVYYFVLWKRKNSAKAGPRKSLFG